VTLLARVAAVLRDERIDFALIGATALAAHGVSRSTMDIDLLVTDQRALRLAWSDFGLSADVRRGDTDDPLAGVIRLSHPGERDVDLVVGRDRWQHDILERARTLDFGDVAIPVAGVADLILLKLYAGGSQDAWDVEQLLASGDREPTVTSVDAAVRALPPAAQALWRRLRPGE
jgi:predicted nucleotidyltransferase